MIDMSPNLTLVAVIVVLVAAGVYLMLERSLTRVLIGVVLIGNGINLLILTAGGRAGGPPLYDPENPGARMSDPLPQAMILTAIVITLGISAFLATLAYRSWQLNRHDEVQDDLEDRRIARLAAADQLGLAEDTQAETGTTLEEDAAQVRDETVTRVREEREHREPREHRERGKERGR